MTLLNTVFRQILPRMNIMLINQLAMLISLPWLTSHLTLQTFGHIATGIIIVQIIWIISGWGVMNYVVEVWNDLKGLEEENFIITQILYLKLSLTIVALIAIFILIYFNIVQLPWVFFFCLIPSAFAGMLPLWFYHVNKCPHELVVATLIPKVLFLILILCLVNQEARAHWFFLIQGLSFLLTTCYAFYQMKKKYHFRACPANPIKIHSLFKKCFPYYLNMITTEQMNSIWGLCLVIGAGPIAIAYYNLSDQAYRAGSLITNTVAQVVRVNIIHTTLTEAWSLVSKLILTVIFFAIAAWLLLDNIVDSVMPENYHAALPYIRMMIGVWLLQSCIKFLNYPILGKIIGVDALNRLNTFMLSGHIFLMVFWLWMFNDLTSLISLFMAMSVFHLSYFLLMTLFSSSTTNR